MEVTEKNRDILAWSLWGRGSRRNTGRANGRGLDDPQPCRRWQSQAMVRRGEERRGEDYAGVCQASPQFSCWNKNDSNYLFLSSARDIPFRKLA